MKTLKIMVATLLLAISGINSYAQMMNPSTMSASKSETFKVYGNCSSCKARIEKAAMLNGVSTADWNKDTNVLTLVYNPSKVSSDAILKNIAAVGHDNEKFKADNKAYNSLPGCCQYERKK